MASTKPRTGIPTPGRPTASSSGIPTPGAGSRSRSSSQVGYIPSSSSSALDQEYMNLAFKDAIKTNDPASHRTSLAHSQSQGAGLNKSIGRAKTPTSMRPPSRQSDASLGVRSVSRAGWVPEVGDAVRIESLGFEGILRFVGEIDGKQGLWAGVELSGGFAGKGKNDGSVAGKKYFSCPPKCGVFVATTKLSPPTVRPPSVASSRGGRTTPSMSTSTSGRITPSSFSMSRSSVGGIGRISYGSGRTTPSTSGRITPSTSTTGGSPETPAVRAARLRATAKSGSSTSTGSTAGTTPVAKSKSYSGPNQVPVPVPGVPTPGTRASKYAGMTAKQLSLNKSSSSPAGGKSSPSSFSMPGSPKTALSPLTATTNIPAASPTRIRTISGIGSPFSTPKPRIGTGFTAPSSGIASPAAKDGTPKPRIPSAVAMPPPPLPLSRGSPIRSVSAASTASTASIEDGMASPTRRARITDVMNSDDLEARGRALQERIAGLTGSKAISPPLSDSSPPQAHPPASPVRRGTIVASGTRARSRSRTTTTASPRRPPSRTQGGFSRPSSVASGRSSAFGTGMSGRASIDAGSQDRAEQLQSRVDALEYENQRLRQNVDDLQAEKVDAVPVGDSPEVKELTEKLGVAEGEKGKLETEKRRLEERRSELEVAYDRNEAEKSRLEEEKRQLQEEKSKLEDVNSALQNEKERLEIEKSQLHTDKAALEGEKAAVEKGKSEVEERLRKMTIEFEEERRDLGERIDELRQAGQETIALYEEKLRQSDLQRYELEDRVIELEAQVSSGLSRSTGSKGVNGVVEGERRSPSSASSTTAVSSAGGLSEGKEAVAQTVSQIEAETVQLQLSHLQQKVSSLEELLDDTRSNHEAEIAAFTTRIERAKEREEGMRKEVTELKRELGEAKREKERVAREGERRVMEVEEALRESNVTMEEMRAELEGLRGEVTNANGLAASTSSTTGELQSKLTEAQIRAEVEKEGFLDEIQRLSEKMAEWEGKCERLNRLTEEQNAELESLKKKVNRDITINGSGIQSPTTASKQEKYDKHELNSAKEEIMGLKHIIQELQKESLAENQRNKVLESENQLLISEMEQLRQEVKILEDNLDQSILREEENLNLDGAGDDVDGLKKTLKEQRLKADKEIEQLRKKLADAEMKSARTSHDLNKEISELESLVEAKIYREDELEQEVEHLKEKLARQQRKSSKLSTGPEVTSKSEEAPDHTPTPTATHSANPSISSNTSTSSVDVCEICEQPGHDIFSCELLKENGPLSAKSMTSAAHKAINGDAEEEDVWCEDCEGYGHRAANCPNSEDVF